MTQLENYIAHREVSHGVFISPSQFLSQQKTIAAYPKIFVFLLKKRNKQFLLLFAVAKKVMMEENPLLCMERLLIGCSLNMTNCS